MRDAILEVLRRNTGRYVSGEDISRMLAVSRTAVWKHIQILREEGYVISSHPRQGYCLERIPDLLLPGEIKHNLETTLLARDIIHFYTVDSTNAVAKKLAGEGYPEGTMIVAEAQTAGRGRLSRQWLSPERGGIWFSLILRPRLLPADAPKITFLAAVAVTRGIRELTGLPAMIKWPNDILVNERKVCGILTEMQAEVDCIDYVVTGIGINVNVDMALFPVDIRGAATSLSAELGREVHRVALLRQILRHMEQLYREVLVAGFGAVLASWRDLSSTLGRQITVLAPQQQFAGVAVDIDEDGALLVRVDRGGIEKVIAGDVSIRPQTM